MTDSPLGTYNNAIPPALTTTTAVTPSVFSLISCTHPVLVFNHDYVIDNRPPSQDVGLVEISADDGMTWTELVSYSGGVLSAWEHRTWRPRSGRTWLGKR
jgi:hypothetical protein